MLAFLQSQRRLRPSAGRWLLLGLAIATVAAVGIRVHSLRGEAAASRQADQRLLDVRYLISASDRAAWQIVAQGFPSSTVAGEIAGDLRRTDADLRQIERTDRDSPGVRRLAGWVPSFKAALATVPQLVAAGRVAAARAEVLTGVDGVAQSMQRQAAELSAGFATRAAAATGRLYAGTPVVLGVSAALVGLLVFVFMIGRRRTAAIERSVLERSERRFRALVQRASEVVLLADADRRIRYATDAATELFGRSPEALVDIPLEDLVPVGDHPRLFERYARTVSSGPLAPSEWQIVRQDGSCSLVEARTNNLLSDPDVAGIVITLRDITEARAMEIKLRHQALHDPLTGLANRELFEDRVAQALHRLSRKPGQLAVLYLDFDGFKAVNDSLGHAAGDELLQVVAGRIDESLRGSDTAARLGGDEFACLLEEIDEADAFIIADRLRTAVGRPVAVHGRSVNPRASIGIAYASDPRVEAVSLIRHADLAMYKAKVDPQGEIAVFDQNLAIAARRKLDLREDLGSAIARGQFTLAYQPLFHLSSRTVVGAEALLRWQHPEHGLIAPDRFIPVAEETGQMVSIGRWVLDTALADLARWSASSPALRVSVNVAPRELAERDYVQAISEALARHGVEPGRLTLELTESELADDSETLAALEALAATGVRLAIDDFGTGQSSLARLQRLPVTEVKLDRSFLTEIEHSPQNATLVRSLIALGQALGLQMVAEGIERDSQLEMLREPPAAVRVDVPDALGQGFLLARPQPAAAFAELLGDSSATT
jgi:diguanylate cyclase (GGDEF)-like protein/PAS domain S-box-containing protein